MSVTMTWNGAAVTNAIKTASARAAGVGATIIQREVRKRVRLPGLPGLSPAMRTQRLASAVQVRADPSKPSTYSVNVDSPGASVNEFGGVVTSKGKPLPVPISAEAVAASARGLTVQQAFRNRVFAHKGSLVENVGGNLVTHYELRKTVRMQANPYLRPGVAAATPQVRASTEAILRTAVKS